jgi:hypothetical protein
MNVKNRGYQNFLDGTLPHPKYSPLRTTCFVLHQKVLSHETDTIHQFTFRVDQFCSF